MIIQQAQDSFYFEGRAAKNQQFAYGGFFIHRGTPIRQTVIG
jgi:hypothetical protein